MSLSVNPAAFEDVRKKMKIVHNSLPLGSKITIIPILDNAYPSPFEPYSFPDSICDMTNMKIKHYQKVIDQRWNETDSLLQDRYNKLVKNGARNETSCIMETLETSYEFFKNKNGTNNYLFYFSDMLEDCDDENSPVGGIHFCKHRYQLPDENRIGDKIDSLYDPGFNLYRLLGKNIYFIITSNYPSEDKCLSLSDNRDIWLNHVLNRMGYSEGNKSSVHFVQSIPAKFSESMKD